MIAIPFKGLTAEDTIGMALHFMWPLSIDRYFKDYIRGLLAHQSVLHGTCSLYKERLRTMPFLQSFKKQEKSLFTTKGSLAEDSNRPQNTVQKNWKHTV